MSVDIASLVFEFDASQAGSAEKAMDRLEKAADRVEKAAKRAKSATELAGIGMRASADGAARATKTATELANAETAYQRASRASTAASAALRAQRALEAAAMRDLVQAGKEHDRYMAKGKASADALRMSIDPLAASIDRLNDELAEAKRLNATGFLSDADHAKAISVLTQRQNDLVDAQSKGIRSSKGLTLAGLDLSRQFADIGVTAAMGMNPLMILIQQGPQIADRFALMRMEGIKLTAVLGAMYGAVAPLLVPLAAIGAVAGVAFGGAALAARALNQENGKATDSLKLTEDQLERLKDKGVNTGVTIGDVFRGTFNYIAKGVGEALDPVAKWFAKLFDDLTRWSLSATKAIVGGFTGAFEAIRATWRMLPAAIGDMVVTATNATLAAIEKLINFAGNGINFLIEKANDAAKRFGLPTIGAVGSISLGRAENPWSGAAASTGQAGAAAFQQGYDRGGQWVDGVLKGLSASILAARDARVTKAAGKAGDTRTAASPRDMNDERGAQFDAMLAQAQQEELQAQLSVTHDIEQRARLQKDIITAELAEKTAQLARQSANVDYDLEKKRITAETAKELKAQIELVGITQAIVSSLHAQAIDEQKADDLRRQATALEVARLEARADGLDASARYARTEVERFELAQKTLDVEADIRRAKLQELAALAKTDSEQERARVEQEAFEEGERKRKAAQAMDRAEFAFNATANALNDVVSGFRNKNWVQMARGIQESIALFRTQLGAAGGAIGAIAGAASMVGGLVGGKAGAVIGGAGSGAMAGMMLGGPIGAGIGAVVGGLGGLFGANKAKKQAEAQKAEQIANALLSQRIELLKAEGKVIEARNEERGAALAKADPSLRAGMLATWNAQDSRAIQDEGQSLTQRLRELDDQLLGTTSALAWNREQELNAVDPLNKHLVELAHAREDELAAIERQRQIADARTNIELRILEAKGLAEEALTLKRRLEREEAVKLDAALGVMLDGLYAAEDAAKALAEAQAAADKRRADAEQRVADARQALQEAYAAEQNRLTSFIDRLKSLASSLNAYGQQLAIQSLQAGGSGGDIYTASRGEFLRVQQLVAAKDERGFADLEKVSSEFLQVSKDFAPDALTYLRDLQQVRASVKMAEEYALLQVTEAQKELDLLQKQVSHLIEIRDATLAVPEAISALEAAIKSANDNGGGSGGGGSNPASGLVTNGLFEGFTRQQLYGWRESPYELPAPMYQAWLTLQALKEAGYNVPGFATGGGFQVGGAAGTDSQLVSLRASANEHVSVTRRDPSDLTLTLISEVRSLREELAMLRRDNNEGNATIALHTRKTREATEDMAEIMEEEAA